MMDWEKKGEGLEDFNPLIPLPFFLVTLTNF